MKNDTVNIEVFFALLRAGLWEKDVRLSGFRKIDFDEVYRLAEEQAVIGLVAAGIEHVVDMKMPQDLTLQLIGETLQLEQRNIEMNTFICKLVKELRASDVYTILVKGQGVAQCYERPLWRSSGDVDFYLSKDNYIKAKKNLLPLAQIIEQEDNRRLHLGMSIDGWVVELHGTMYTELSDKMNRVADDVYNDIFYGGSVRSWDNNGVQVFLPSANNDVIIIFNHFINHFYGEGVGLRQICDWCRLLMTFKEIINLKLLEERLKKEKLLIEWKTFGTFAIEYLGMSDEAMPFCDRGDKYKRKAEKIFRLIIETGNFGQNKDSSYRVTSPKMQSYLITFFRRFKEFARLTTIFPVNAPRFFVKYVFNRARAVL